MTLFTAPVRPDDICDIIDLTVEGNEASKSMAIMQREGIASLYNILCDADQPFAYLADDVGMGKTYQAIGLAAMVWNEKPNARILFISPRQNLQYKWKQDFQGFFTNNYRRWKSGDDRVTSVLLRQPLHQPMIFENLREYARTLDLPERIAPLIRHTSFMRPIVLPHESNNKVKNLWDFTVAKLQKSGLTVPDPPEDLTLDDASYQLNLTFAKALNQKLSEIAGKEPYFDLVIVDEAQCLRNPWNQTNEVLHSTLKDQVNHWLFMSATPTHAGLGDLPTILNHYPKCKGEALNLKLLDDPIELQLALQKFLVRRTRKYLRKDESKVSKGQYRDHDKETWKVKDNEMGVLETLAVGLVQKGLDKLLQNEGNRYKIGFLSSFESLQSSIAGKKSANKSNNDPQASQKQREYETDQASGVTETDAPDANFINKFATEFDKKFNEQLPHPKVDSVVKQVAESAFGTKSSAGGEKFLIFTRRVSTVKTLQEKLAKLHEKSIDERIKNYWGRTLDWSGKDFKIEETEDEDDPENSEIAIEKSRFREAMAEKGWLYRYKKTFRGSGRNSLFFEDGWLNRLCRAGGENPTVAAKKLPECIWAEAWSRGPNSEKKRFRYIAVQALERCPEIFGLDKKTAKPWLDAYQTILHEYVNQVQSEQKKDPEPDLFSFPTLWTVWDEYALKDPKSLPDIQSNCKNVSNYEDLLKRQVIRTILGQIFRLTDTLIDLYFADQASDQIKSEFPRKFLDWLSSNQASASQLRKDCSEWIKHLRLIINSCLGGVGKNWQELAKNETWQQLNYLLPVAGITGGSGAHKTAVPLFRTPSYPKVIVCTDTLKEGVDLHLFCDRVIHYGVAWTSGDLEQRTGRVDRYFSLIERRLAENVSPEIKLHVGYPYVESSLELGQVERVIENQVETEKLLDSFWTDSKKGVNEVDLNLLPRSSKRIQEFEPFLPIDPPKQGRSLKLANKNELEKIINHYKRWYENLLTKLNGKEWQISFKNDNPVQDATIYRKIEKSNLTDDTEASKHNITWSYDATLERYVLTISNIPKGIDSETNTSIRNKIVEDTQSVDSFLQILVPKPDEDQNDIISKKLIEVLETSPQEIHPNARNLWDSPLASLAIDKVEWLSDYKAKTVISRESRKQLIYLHAEEGRIHLYSVVASLKDIENREEIGGEANIKNIRKWALDKTKDLPIGYFYFNSQNKLVYGNQLIHGNLSKNECKRLIEEVAWRADIWEAVLTGKDEQ